jgi:hypothetical protein
MIGMLKAQADIISAVIIITIAIGLVYTAYSWGLPLIQKKQDAALAERVFNYFNQKNENSLPNKIEYIAKNRGEETFTLDANGIWIINQDEDSISFTFFSRASNIAVGDWISLTTGVKCSSTGIEPSTGIVGDKPSVVCARADLLQDGYNITYKVWFRQLNETGGERGYKINLLKHPGGPSSSTGKYVRIFYDRVYQEQTLIITEIKILLG